MYSCIAFATGEFAYSCIAFATGEFVYSCIAFATGEFVYSCIAFEMGEFIILKIASDLEKLYFITTYLLVFVTFYHIRKYFSRNYQNIFLNSLENLNNLFFAKIVYIPIKFNKKERTVIKCHDITNFMGMDRK